MKRIALAIETSHGSGREVLRGIALHAHEVGNWRLFHAPRGLLEAVPDWLRDWEGDGVIARVQDPASAALLIEKRLPVVDVLGVVEQANLPVVHVDDDAIGRMAARFLAAAGLRTFGFFGIAEENWSRSRLNGFREAVKEEGGTLKVLEASRSLESDSRSLLETIGSWLREIPLPAGIMVSSDQRALPLLESCRELGIPVPEMASVISVDNDACLCELSTPALTSIRAGHFEAGYQAAKLLDRMLDGEEVKPGSRLLVSASGIVERDSTDAPVVSDMAVARGLRYIRENLAADLTNQRIAREAGISRALFQRRFRAATGRTVQHFVTASRLKKVERLMAHDRLTLAQIAELCGFRHQQYLGYIVRRELGKTPAKWRKELQKLRG